MVNPFILKLSLGKFKGKLNTLPIYTNNSKGPGMFNELGSWITYQLIQAYQQYGVGSPPAL
jgi:hypothetical protein